MADGSITVEVSTQAAQAELERLRAENTALKHDLQYAREGLTKGRTRMREDIERLQAENAALKREAHTWSKAAEHYAKPLQPLTREQIDAVMTEHYPLSSLLREEVDAFERCVRDLERLHGIGA